MRKSIRRLFRFPNPGEAGYSIAREYMLYFIIFSVALLIVELIILAISSGGYE